MKLDRLTIVGAAAAAALACGCSTTQSLSPPKSAMLGAHTDAVGDRAVSNTTGTTNLMSAQLLGPAPRVGKAHLAVDLDERNTDAAADSLDESAPKDVRRSDGSRRGGGFGASK